jgi:hypothetical protein
MKLFTVFLLGLTMTQLAGAMTCPQIRAKAAPSKSNAKSGCVLIDHTIGISPGSTETTYDCGGKKYRLTTLKNDNCTVKNL